MSRYIGARDNTLLFGGLVAILLMIGAVSWNRSGATWSARQWSQHTYGVPGVIWELAVALQVSESAQRGYLMTGDDDYLAPYQVACGRVGVLQGKLQQLTAGNRAQQDRLRLLAPPCEAGWRIWLRRHWPAATATSTRPCG